MFSFKNNSIPSVLPDPFYVLIKFMVITRVVQVDFIFLSALPTYQDPVIIDKLNAFICDAPSLY